jgi:hypothetical protein
MAHGFLSLTVDRKGNHQFEFLRCERRAEGQFQLMQGRVVVRDGLTTDPPLTAGSFPATILSGCGRSHCTGRCHCNGVDELLGSSRIAPI